MFQPFWSTNLFFSSLFIIFINRKNTSSHTKIITCNHLFLYACVTVCDRIFCSLLILFCDRCFYSYFDFERYVLPDKITRIKLDTPFIPISVHLLWCFEWDVKWKGEIARNTMHTHTHTQSIRMICAYSMLGAECMHETVTKRESEWKQLLSLQQIPP